MRGIYALRTTGIRSGAVKGLGLYCLLVGAVLGQKRNEVILKIHARTRKALDPAIQVEYSYLLERNIHAMPQCTTTNIMLIPKQKLATVLASCNTDQPTHAALPGLHCAVLMDFGSLRDLALQLSQLVFEASCRLPQTPSFLLRSPGLCSSQLLLLNSALKSFDSPLVASLLICFSRGL